MTHRGPAETAGRVAVAVVLGIAFFWWGLRFLLGGRVSYLAAMPGAVATIVCLAGLRVFSGLVFEPLNWSIPEREEHTRDHVFTNDEIRHVWVACRGAIWRYHQVTNPHRSEARRDREFTLGPQADLDRKLISLPRERTKNARPHEIPISPTAASILSSRDSPSLNPEREFVFGRRPFGGWSRSKQALDALLGERVRPWHLHDLRRTAATGMADIGVQPHIIEAVLNHQSGHKAGIAGIYNRSSYTKEKAEALARWDERVASLVVGCGQWECKAAPQGQGRAF